MADRILRTPQVIEICGVGRSTIYDWIAQGAFPKPIKLGASAIGWRASDVQSWIDDRDGKTPERLRAEAAAMLAHAEALEAESKAA
jgi:prophage regulatory protein